MAENETEQKENVEKNENIKLTALIDPEQLKCLEEEVSVGKYRNVSEATRAAIREHNEFGKELESVEELQAFYRIRDIRTVKDFLAYVVGLEQKIIKKY